jgi:hypothetical protein
LKRARVFEIQRDTVLAVVENRERASAIQSGAIVFVGG